MLGLVRPIRAGGVVALACFLVALAFSASAHATGEYEQNDSRETAYGPLAGGVDYTGTFETENDVDWFVFYVKAYSQMDISSTSIGSSCAAEWGSIVLRDKDGKSIKYFEFGALNELGHLHLTMTAGRYYLEIYGYRDYCTGDQYRFRIDPAASITSSRECGEAIVARDSISPELAKLQEPLSKNSEALAKASGAAKSAKRALTRLKRRNAASWKKRRARRKLTEANATRKKVLEQRAGLQGLVVQYTTALQQAEGQIATSC